MSMMDVTIANVALPTIGRDLHATASESIWIVNAYQFAMTVAIVPFAALGDILGYARIYRIGLAAFTLASLACTLSHTLVLLALARIAQGFGAAAMTSTIGSLNRLAFPRAMLGRAAGQTATFVALGAAAGPIVGGAILGVATWPWLFAVNVPVGIVTLLLGARVLPRAPGTGQPFDWVSALQCAMIFGLLIAGIDGMGHGERLALVVSELVLAIVLGSVFVRAQSRAKVPVFAVDLFRQPVFALSIVSSVTSFIAQTIAYVSLPFAFENILGRTPLATGLLMTPWLIAMAVMAPLAGRLSDRYNAGVLGGIGMVLLALGLIGLACMHRGTGTLAVAVPMLVCGIGYGLFQSPNNRTILASAPRNRTGAAQGILATARLTGQTIGAALVALVFAALAAGPGRGRTPSEHEITVALGVAVAFAALAAIASSLRRASPQVEPAR
jgi:DHA2 family multidrug resistance protein-like MFS transporter